MTAECVLQAGAVLGGGPMWHDSKLWWVDIEARRLHQFDPQQNRNQTWQMEERVTFVVPAAKGDFIIGLGGETARFDPRTGSATPLATPETHLPGNRFNDAKCDSAGRLWAGTMSI